MAGLKVTFLPVSIFETGDVFEVYVDVRFDGGDYATGGIAPTWDYTTALNAGLLIGAFRKVSQVHATRPPIAWSVFSGYPALTFQLVPVATSPLPTVIVMTSSTGAEFANATPLTAGIQGTTPLVPNTVLLRFKNEL